MHLSSMHLFPLFSLFSSLFVGCRGLKPSLSKDLLMSNLEPKLRSAISLPTLIDKDLRMVSADPQIQQRSNFDA